MKTTPQDAWTEAHEDFPCVCGGPGYLHDDGTAACVHCDSCPEFRPVAVFVASLKGGK